jgi:hypothetical protein
MTDTTDPNAPSLEFVPYPQQAPNACRTTRHCADHGFCRRCQPEFSAVMSQVNVAIQRTDPDETHWGPLYEAIGKVLLAADQGALRDYIANILTPFFANFSDDDTARVNAGEAATALAAVLPAPADRSAEELAKRVTRAIFALKSPAPSGSEHYRAGWDDCLEAAMDAARDAVVDWVAAETPPAETQTAAAVVARVLAVAEVIEANGITWAADSIRRACSGDAEQPRTCGNCGQVHASHSLTHFGAQGGPWYCVDRDDCRAAGGLPPRKPTGVEAQPGKDTETQRCVCKHPADEHSVYGCADGCGCGWMPPRRMPSPS